MKLYESDQETNHFLEGFLLEYEKRKRNNFPDVQKKKRFPKYERIIRQNEDGRKRFSLKSGFLC
jgi:hypothetical protein